VRALPREFEQLLANLIGNAAKFVAPGVRPEIRLSCEHDDAGWRFELADNGIGIEPRYTDRVFGMFQRLHGGVAYPGTGIGSRSRPRSSRARAEDLRPAGRHRRLRVRVHLAGLIGEHDGEWTPRNLDTGTRKVVRAVLRWTGCL
jgi:hypothetical protein